jgi:capsular polysaccharide biosynthesis protein
MRIIFHIEERGNDYIYHWLMYMIAGLRYLPHLTKGSDSGGSIEQNKHLFNLNDVQCPYYIYIPALEKKVIDYQLETLDIIKDKYIIVKKDEISENDVIVSNYGEYVDTPGDGYIFLRDLFMSRVPIHETQYKKIFILRSKSHLLAGNSGLKRRHILNESEIVDELLKLGIHSIYLEDFTFRDKISIFNNAELIISPGSGGLSFLIFANKNVKIIEIHVDHPHQKFDQYSHICSSFNLNYYKFYSDKIDRHDNMIINKNKFIDFVQRVCNT